MTVQALALSGALSGCTFYKGNALFDPFGELERSGGERIYHGTGQAEEDEYRFRQGRRAQQAPQTSPPQTQVTGNLFNAVAQGELIFDTTDGTTEPQGGEWVSHGSVPGQELKKRNVDPNVTLEERRSRNDGNGSRQ